MRVLVISNDVIEGFGVPVAAPGLRATGLAVGLREHGHEVSISVPEDLLGMLFGSDIPEPPDGAVVVSPTALMAHIDATGAEVVVFINSNMSSHLQPRSGVRFIYDFFAPKILESTSSAQGGRSFSDVAAEKERALALADEVWVNGQRKMGYALGWMLRDGVEQLRTESFGFPSLRSGDLTAPLRLVEMPVALPDGISPDDANGSPGPGTRIGIAGYAQNWSTLSSVARGHSTLVDHGHELHALTPQHWAADPSNAPINILPAGVVQHEGPLPFAEFAEWVQGMDAMVDLFAPSAERSFAMVTRSAVALRLGVPLIHAVDSEISDLIQFYDAGWVLDPDDGERWEVIATEVGDPAVLARKRSGAKRVSVERFEPRSALFSAATQLGHRA